MAFPMSPLVFALIIVFFASSSLATSVTYSVLDYGAKPGGRTDSTQGFLAAWKQVCSSTKPATMYVPPGKFLLRDMVFRGKCKNDGIIIRIDGTLVAPSDYHVIGHSENWLLFENVYGVSIFGGIIDGQGTSLWNCKAHGKKCPRGATVCTFPSSFIIFLEIFLTSVTIRKCIFMHGCVWL